MKVFEYMEMALILVECADENHGSDIHYVSIGTNANDTEDDIKKFAVEHLIKRYPSAKVIQVIRLDYDSYTKILNNQFRNFLKV